MKAFQGIFLSVLAKTQFVQNGKTQFEKAKTQFENRKSTIYCKFYTICLKRGSFSSMSLELIAQELSSGVWELCVVYFRSVLGVTIQHQEALNVTLHTVGF